MATINDNDNEDNCVVYYYYYYLEDRRHNVIGPNIASNKIILASINHIEP
jgi:hypothetical protein